MGMEVSRVQHVPLSKILASLSTEKVLKVGWPKAIRYPEKEGGEYIAFIAAQNEYGNPLKRIPPRPFMAPAVALNKTKWLEILRRGINRTLQGRDNIEGVLNQVGRAAADDVKRAIRAVTAPALSPVTIAKRKARYTSKGNKKKINPTTLEKPLVDTGIMLRSVTHAVEEE
jgi:hypothetical protein